MPTDDDLNAEYTQKTTPKKKKPGAGAMVGPPTIVPPVMQDWAAQAGGGAAEPAAPGLIGNSPQAAALAQSLKQRALAKAAPAQAPAAPDFGGPARYAQDQLNAPVDPEVQAGMASIEKRRLREGLQRRFSQMAGGASPEQIARADEMAGIRYERENIDRSNRPIQKVQSPTEVTGARDSIRQNLIQNADTIHKRAMDAIAANPQMQQTDPAQYAKLMEEVSRAEHMRGTAMTKLASYGEGGAGLENPEVTRIIGAQREIRARQLRDRGIGEAASAPLAYDTAAEKAAGLAQRDKGRRLQEAAANTAIAQTQQAGAEATIASDEDVIRKNIEAARARATMEARMAGAQGRAGMRGAAYEGAGMGSEQSILDFNERARKVIQSGDERALELTIIPQIRQIAETDPDEAQRLMNSLQLDIENLRPSWMWMLGGLVGAYTGSQINKSRKERLLRSMGQGTPPQ